MLHENHDKIATYCTNTPKTHGIEEAKTNQVVLDIISKNFAIMLNQRAIPDYNSYNTECQHRNVIRHYSRRGIVKKVDKEVFRR